MSIDTMPGGGTQINTIPREGTGPLYSGGGATPLHTSDLGVTIAELVDGLVPAENLPPAVATLSRSGIPASMVGIGDSMTESSAERGSYLDYIMLARSPIRILANAGVGGQPSSVIRARFDADVVALAPGLVAILAGANDSDPSTTIPNLLWMYERAIEFNILPILVTRWRSADTVVQSQNAWIRAYAVANNLPLVDWWQIMTLPDGTLKAGYTIDNQHPSHIGCAAMAAEFRRVVEPLVTPSGPFPVAETNDDPTNLFTNPLFLTNTANVPTGWTELLGSGRSGKVLSVVTDVADTTGTRNVWRIVNTASVQNGAYGATVSAGVVATGHIIEFSGRIKTTGSSGIAWSIIFAVAGVPIWIGFDGFVSDIDGYFSKRLVMPSGGGAIAAYIYLSTGTGTFEISQWALRDITALGV